MFYRVISTVIFCALLSTSLLFISCNSDDEVLASYEKEQKIHTINRRQLRWLLKMRAQNAKSKKASTDLQQKALKSYLFSQILAHEIDPKIRQSKQYQRQVLFLKEKAKLSAYELYLREKDESLQLDFIEAQFIFLRKEKGKSKDSHKGQKEAENLLQKLNSKQMSSSDIEEQVYQISEHPRYRLQGGYLDPICVSCSANPLRDVMEEIKKAKPAAFIMIQRPNAFWLLRVIKEYSVDEDEVQEKFETFYRKRARVARKYLGKLGSNALQKREFQSWFNQKEMEKLARQTSEWLLQKEKNSFVFSKLNKLRKKRKYTIYPAAKISSISKAGGGRSEKIKYREDTPLYSLDGKDYKYGDLQREIKKIHKDEGAEIQGLARELRIMHALLIPLSLLEKEEDFQKAMKSGFYDFVYSFIKTAALTLAYYQQEKEKIELSQTEVLKNYKEYKETHYKGKTKKETLKLIRRSLKQKIFEQWKKKKQAELSKKYKLVIENKLLKADQV